MSETNRNKRNNFSYGFELELSDIDRRIDIPEYLGSWEGDKVNGFYQASEIDVVNTMPPFRGVGTDPLAEWCTVGGEINVAPTTNIDSQFKRVLEIFNLFPVANSAHVNHFHIHIHIPNIKTDVELIKRFTKYVLRNQEHLVEVAYLQDFYVSENISDWGREYLKTDGGRLISASEEEVDKCTTADEVLELFNRPSHYRDGNKTIAHSSKRTGVNMANLLRGETVEFRCFRSTTKDVEIVSELIMVERFCEEAIKEDIADQKSVPQLLNENFFSFAPLNYVHELQLGWELTRASKDRGYEIKYSKVQFKEPQDECHLD